MNVSKRTNAGTRSALGDAARATAAWHREGIAVALGLVIVAVASLCIAPQVAHALVPVAGLCSADLNQDGIVGARDGAAVSNAWSAVPGDEDWDAALDLTGDFVVGGPDLALLLSLWGRTDECDDSAVAPPTLWTGTLDFHEGFCPDGAVFLEAHEAHEAQEPEGAPLYRVTLAPEECLRAPLPGSAVYTCEVGGRVVSSIIVEAIADEFVTEEGYHVCNQRPQADWP
ncbi:MAG: hypothetical protein JRG96_21075 [Deltaproteobacteria bacterium]|nr:hypothetical protein [Deltaproteobacteria bacterium]MBW2419168.1 hypothetical protein [Deltaproteobacteria bacterium]